MKKIILLLALSLFLSNCKKENNNHQSPNLITNSGFENGSSFDLSHWTGNLANYSTDTPNNSGYALQLRAGWLPDEGYAETVVGNLVGTYDLQLSLDYKVLTNNGAGRVIVYKSDRNGNRTELISQELPSHSWQIIHLNFMTTLSTFDSLIIHLSAGSTELGDIRVLYDNVSLVTN